MSERGSVRKIAPEEEELRAMREEGARYFDENNVLGKGFMEILPRLAGGIENELAKQGLANIRSRLSEAASLDRFIERAIADPQLARELMEHIGYTREVNNDDGVSFKELTPQEIEEERRYATALRVSEELRMNNKENETYIPDALLARMVQAHVKGFEQKRKLFEREVAIVRETALAQFESIFEAKRLPFDRAEIERRLEGIHIELVDSITSDFEREYRGVFSAQGAAIRISEDTFEIAGELEKTLVHELLHALSGRTVVEREIKPFPEESLWQAEFQRVGLFFLLQNKRFFWLNEAITETLTLDAVPKRLKKYDTYRRERALFERIVASARDPELLRWLFYGAYFEEYRSEGGATGVPAWKELQKELNTSFGPRFLTELEKAMRVAGKKKRSAKSFKQGMAFVDASVSK